MCSGLSGSGERCWHFSPGRRSGQGVRCKRYVTRRHVVLTFASVEEGTTFESPRLVLGYNNDFSCYVFLWNT